MRRGSRRVDYPTPPTNVRIRYPDGSEAPVELVYEGWEGGTHRWVAVPTSPVWSPHAQLLVGALPAHTSITVRSERVSDE